MSGVVIRSSSGVVVFPIPIDEDSRDGVVDSIKDTVDSTDGKLDLTSTSSLLNKEG